MRGRYRMWDIVSCLACPAQVREPLSRQGTVVLSRGECCQGDGRAWFVCGIAAAGHSPWASIWHRCHMGLRMTRMATGCSAHRSLARVDSESDSGVHRFKDAP